MSIKLKRKPAAVGVDLGDAPVLVSVKAKKAAAKAKADESGDYKQIAMLRTIEKPPTIGTYITGDELGIKHMKKGKSYYVPSHVAYHLKDKGAAIIVGESDSDDDDDE